jgi:hypothetical protein
MSDPRPTAALTAWLRNALGALAVGGTAVLPAVAFADGPSAPSPAPAASSSPAATASGPGESSQLDEARELFRSGVAMQQVGDYERALGFFLRSRSAYPSPPNTINAALCLEHLGRFDEALDMYESALAMFADKLDAQDRTAIAAASERLIQKVANLAVTANVTGAVLVDGRQRGTVPLSTPIRVLEGSHVVRVVKDGYKTFETTVEVKPGGTASVDGRLDPLAAAGQLRVEDPGHDGAEILVDGASVGASPWEGTLGPGTHVVWSRAGDTGSAPLSVVVLQGQTALVRLRSGPLGPTVSIVARPATASITLSGVPVGTGSFQTRLPAGEYTVQAAERGYFPSTSKLTLGGPEAAPIHLSLALVVDPSDPRWPKAVERELGHFWVGAFGGLQLSSTLGSSAEVAASGGSPVLGEIIGGRVGFRFELGTSIELSGAYWGMGFTSDRTRSDVFPTNAPRYTVVYSLHDQLRYEGPLLGVGVSQRIRLAGQLMLVPRLTVGLLLGNVRDPVTGTASTGGPQAPVQIAGAGDTVAASRVVIGPEIGLSIPWSGFEFGLGLEVAFLPGSPTDFTYSTIQVAPNCQSTTPGAVGCAPSSSVIAGERALGPFYAWVPLASVSRTF